MNERITVLFPVTDLAMDGAQRQLLELVKGLDKNRFSPIVLTLHPGGPIERELREVPEVQILSLERKGKYDFLCLLKVFNILRRMKVDVVQPFLTPATFFGLLPALLCRTPMKIVTERGGPRNKNTSLGYRIYLKVEDFLSRLADRAVPNSQAGKEYLIQRGIKPSRIKVIYNGINLSRLPANKESVEQVRQRLGLPPGGKVVGMMARLFPVKDHATFLQAAALINKAIPDTRFALVGDGPLRSQLEDMTQELGLGSKAVFFGEQQDVGTYLSAFDIAALTSETEGCSNSLLEAMALEKPVVATDVGGNRELVLHGEAGFLVPRGNPETLAQAIIALLQDPEAAKSMGQRAKERVITQFSLESMVRQYESLYEETLREKTSRGKSTAAGRRAAREMLLLCATSKVAPTGRERISRLLGGPIDWEYLLDLATFHGVVPLLAYNLAANDFSSRVPQLHLNQLKRVYNQTLYINVVLSAEIEKVLSRFSQLKIEAIPLKGVVLAEDLYDHPGLRSVGDMDVLVRPQDVPQARACLTEMGYEVAALEKLINHPFHGAPFFKRGSLPMVLELHWGLDDRRVTAFSDQEIWHRAEPRLLQEFPALTLSPEDNLLFLAYHLTKHDSGLLKLLCDIAELLKKYEKSLDWDYIKGKARSWQIESAAYYSLKRAQDLLEAPLPASVLATIEPGALRRWVLDLLVSQEAFVSPVKGDRLRNETIALAHSLMLKGPRQTLAALSRIDSPEERRAWFKTIGWIALVFAAGLGRYLARAWGRQSLPVGHSMGIAGTIAISQQGAAPATSSEWGSLLIGRKGVTMTKILITKVHGTHKLSCEHNKGSAAVASTTIKALKQCIPDAQFTSFVQFSEEFAEEHGVRVIRSNKLFSTKNLSLRTIVKSSLNVTRCALWALLHKRFPRFAQALVSNRELKEYADADVIIDMSMDLYGDRRGTVSIIEHSKDILLGVFLKKPVIIWAQSPGPFRSKLSSWLVRFTLNRVALITVREEISRSHLHELGVDVPPIHVTADTSFLLEPATEERAKEILSKASIDGSDGPIIGVTIGWVNRISETNTTSHLRTWYLRPMKSILRASSIILPESIFAVARRQASHFMRQDMSSYPKIREITQIVDYLVEKLDATVVLVPHDYNPEADDRILLGEILQRAKQRNRVRLLTGDYSAPEIKAVIGQCDLFIGGKMHSNIAATSMCVPTVAIQYSHKFYGIMRLLGQEKYVCDKLTAEEVKSKVDQAWSDRERIRGELEANIDIVKEHALYNAKLVADLLNSDRVSSVSP